MGRQGPLRKVWQKWISVTNPTTKTTTLYQIDRLDNIYYSEVLECGHSLNLNILTNMGRSWGDNADRRRCEECQASYNALVEEAASVDPEDLREDIRLDAEAKEMLGAMGLGLGHGKAGK